MSDYLYVIFPGGLRPGQNNRYPLVGLIEKPAQNI